MAGKQLQPNAPALAGKSRNSRDWSAERVEKIGIVQEIAYVS